jgi:hypothetical protein
MPGIGRPANKRKNPFPFPRLNHKGELVRGKAMKQSRNSKLNKDSLEEKLSELLLTLFLNPKAVSLFELIRRLTICKQEICKLSLEERRMIPNDLSLSATFHKNKSLSKDWKSLINKHRKDLNVNSMKGSLKLKSIFAYVTRILDQYYTDDNKDMEVLSLACSILGGYKYKNMKLSEIMFFFSLEEILRNASYDAIGYWTAKLEEMIRNTHKGQGKKNKEVIKRILEEMNITTSLTVFRSDKNLKNDFISKAKEETKKIDEKHNQPLDDKTIKDYARAILKEQDNKSTRH